MVARLVSKPTNTLKLLKTKLKSPALIDSAGLLFEPVAHSVKWTTSSREITRNGSKARKSFEPVVYSGKWTTSSREIAGNVPKVRKSFEPVVYSGKWTTSSQEIAKSGSKVRKGFELG